MDEEGAERMQPFDPDKAMPRPAPDFWRTATPAEHLRGIQAACRSGFKFLRLRPDWREVLRQEDAPDPANLECIRRLSFYRDGRPEGE